MGLGQVVADESNGIARATPIWNAIGLLEVIETSGILSLALPK
jgi:hypothetical protein